MNNTFLVEINVYTGQTDQQLENLRERLYLCIFVSPARSHKIIYVFVWPNKHVTQSLKITTTVIIK